MRFALPGGPVWINRGALQAADDRSEMAGVLAHEIAHIARAACGRADFEGDHRERTSWTAGCALGNAGGATTAEAGAQVLAGGYLMTFTREDERAADRVGAAIHAASRMGSARPSGFHGDAAPTERPRSVSRSKCFSQRTRHPRNASPICVRCWRRRQIAAGVTAGPFTPCTARSRDSLRPSECPGADAESGTRYPRCGTGAM